MKRPLLKLLPLLFLYVLIAIKLSSNAFTGDEGGYYQMATRLAHGHIQPENGTTLWWGPGYPAILAPFVFLGLPLLAVKMLNAFFLFGAVVYFYKTLRLYLLEKQAVAFSYLLGLYPPAMRELHLVLTETLVMLLICGFIYNFCKMYRSEKSFWINLLQGSMYLCFLAMVKVFYGYVILAGMVISLVGVLVRRGKMYGLSFCAFLIAFLCCLPYLYYTYSLTNEIFYWGTSGGCNLYWMSSPYQSDLGDWCSQEAVAKVPELAPHRAIYARGLQLSEVERDAYFKKKALSNISNYPGKYLQNYMANTGRLVFSYPFSYTAQKMSTYFYALPNMFIVVLLTFSIYPSWRRCRQIPFELRALIGFALVSLGGTSLIAAVERQFRPLVPVLLLWLSYVFLRLVRIRLRSAVRCKPKGLGPKTER